MGQGVSRRELLVLVIVWLAWVAYAWSELATQWRFFGDVTLAVPGLVVVGAVTLALPVLLTVAVRPGSTVRRRRGRLPTRHLVLGGVWAVTMVTYVATRGGWVRVTDWAEYEAHLERTQTLRAVHWFAFELAVVCALVAVVLTIVDSVRSRRPGEGGPGLAPVPGIGDRIALTAVWASPLLGLATILAGMDLLRAILLAYGWPVLVAGAVWSLWAFQRVLGARSPWLVATGEIPRRFRVWAWVWLVALVVPGLGLGIAADPPPLEDYPRTVAEGILGMGPLGHAVGSVLGVLTYVAPIAALVAVSAATGGGARGAAGAPPQGAQTESGARTNE